MQLRYSVVYLLLLFILILGCEKEEVVTPPPSPPQYKLTDFTPAQVCSTCHPQYYDEWSGSMHHYSSNDPIWRLANNALQSSTEGRLDKTCFQCHAGTAFVTGNTKPTFEFSELPDLVREGVTCDFCHVLRPPFLTTNQRIQYNLQPGLVKYGTLSDPIPTVHEHGYDATYDRSDACKPCHDLIVNNVPVEITNTEWQNSPWGAMSVECQKCHMPTYTGRAAPGAPIRNNLHRHDMPGVDVAITDFPNKPEQRAAIDSILKNAVTVTLDAPTTGRISDSLRFAVCVYNDKTGHNIPTSVFFFRQMWLEVTVWNGIDTAYGSGHLDANGDLMDKNSALRPNEDKDLVMFGGTLYKNGQESNVFELDSLVNNSIKPFECRTSTYRFKVPRAGMWNLRVRLLFRPFGPYLFRALGTDEYVTELPIFEMAVREALIEVR
ncbi:MAG: hypothetical protein HY707_06415 [Ignavibacteriae bacterium]|nr:hypothetical protein [Ignavibacteriota bacterium]